VPVAGVEVLLILTPPDVLLFTSQVDKVEVEEVSRCAAFPQVKFAQLLL
jgi:hypothetical protein